MVNELISLDFWIGLLVSTFQLATPYLLAGLGEAYAERSGVMNLGIEGVMVIGAFGSFLGTKATGDPILGILCAVIVGAFLSLVIAFLDVSLSSDQVIVGITISSMIGWSLVAYLLRMVYKGVNISVAKLAIVPIPFLADIPVVGPILFKQNLLTYLAILLIPILTLILFRTKIGLKIRATGENPKASDTIGIRVYYLRYLCVIFGGIMAALGGSALILGYAGVFNEDLVAGRGWIALALVILGQWNPVGVLWASLLFGAAEALQWRLQALGLGIPPQLLLMLPYLLAIIALVFVSKKSRTPASLGIPYRREEG